ncbi:hypothetical protein HD806DRAFT_497220 [Xylariaceae sp. AK1471]|nr:hypothetical protein HD806DRAFT_497220 [Xylariaceae sp. AK1471]
MSAELTQNGKIKLFFLYNDIFPIPGTKTPKYLTENFDAATVKLNPDEAAHIRSLVNNASIGARYAPEHIFALFADTPLPEEWTAGDNKGKTQISGNRY